MYPDAKTHAELEKLETGSTRPAAILKIDKRCISAIYEPISMKICTQTQKHMPNSKNLRSEVLDLSHMTAAVAILLTDKRCILVIYEPISIEISTQTQTHMPISRFMKVESTEVTQVSTVAAMFHTGFL